MAPVSVTSDKWPLFLLFQHHQTYLARFLEDKYLDPGVNERSRSRALAGPPSAWWEPVS